MDSASYPREVAARVVRLEASSIGGSQHQKSTGIVHLGTRSSKPLRAILVQGSVGYGAVS